MMTKQVPDPERWTDRPADGSSVEDLMGAALRRARAATAPLAVLCERLEIELDRRAPGVTGTHRWRVAIVALVVLLAAAGSVGAARQPLRAWAGRHGFLAPPPAPAPSEVPRRARRAAEMPPPEAEPIAAPPALAAALAAEPAAPPALAPAPAPRPEPVEPAGEAPGAEEARALQAVFRALRSEARADVALAALDDYDRRFPAGLLRDESRLARVEALLALGRRDAARSLLVAWEAEGVPMPRAAREALAGLRAP